VRLDTAYAHILLSDRATAENGMALLDNCAVLSSEYGLMHQFRSIELIRRSFEKTNGHFRREPGTG
jgi:hypothetical protein